MYENLTGRTWWETVEHCVTCTLHEMLLGDQVKENEMGGTRITKYFRWET